jgi:predicted nucleic acid-binding protein
VILVLDASVLVAVLVDSGAGGAWAAAVLGMSRSASPDTRPSGQYPSCAAVAVAGDITAGSASLAHGDVLDLRVELWPHAPLAERCWQLRENVTTYEASTSRWRSCSLLSLPPGPAARSRTGTPLRIHDAGVADPRAARFMGAVRSGCHSLRVESESDRNGSEPPAMTDLQ